MATPKGPLFGPPSQHQRLPVSPSQYPVGFASQISLFCCAASIVRSILFSAPLCAQLLWFLLAVALSVKVTTGLRRSLKVMSLPSIFLLTPKQHNCNYGLERSLDRTGTYR